MSKKDAIDFFDKKNYKVTFFESPDSSTVAKAAECLGVTENEIGKTLAFWVNDEPIVILMSGESKVCNTKYKNKFSVKAKMISFDDVNVVIGHPVGGVCPFGVKDGVKIYLDESLKNLEYIYPAAGEINAALKILVADLDKLLDIEWIDISK